MTNLQVAPVCGFFSKLDPSIFCPDYGSSDCPFSLNSDVVACPKTKRAASGFDVEFSLPCGGVSFKPSCSSCAHLFNKKDTRLCGLAMDCGRWKDVELTDVCENWLYDV